MAAADDRAEGSKQNAAYPWLLLLPFGVVVALNVLGLLSPSIHTWGFNIWGAFHPASLAAIVILFAVCSIPVVAVRITQAIITCVDWCAARSALDKGIAVGAISLFVGGLFVFFRSESPIYGDGYTVVANSTRDIFAPPETFHETIKMVPVMLYRIGAALLTKQMHLDPQLSFGIASSIGGVVGFWGLWQLARSLGRTTGESVALMAAGLAGGGTILFFGHLELYTWAVAVLLWLLAAAVEYVDGRAPASAVWIWLVVAAAMQALFLPTILVIVLVLVAIRRSPSEKAPFLAFKLSPTIINWGVLFCSIAAGLFFSLVRTEFSFVHLWVQPDNPYWALSSAHLMDILSLVFLVAPTVLMSVILTLTVKAGEGRIRMELGEKILGTCALSLFLVTFWLDPGLGALRDWDLLSFFGFPAAVFGAVLLLKRFPGPVGSSLVTSLSLCLILLVPTPHIAERLDVEKALSRLDPMVWMDAHYQPSYDAAHGTVPWAALIQAFTKQPELADKYFWRKISVDPKAEMAWYNLGENELRRGHFDSAVVVLAEAYKLSPASDIIMTGYAEALQSNGDTARLRDLLPRLANVESNSPKILGYAGIILAKEGKLAEAIPLLKKASLLRPWEYKPCMNLALAYFQLELYDSSTCYFQKAIPLLPPADRTNALRAVLQGQIKLGRITDARATLRELEHQFPDDPAIPQVKTLLGQ